MTTLETVSAVEALAGALRDRILDGDLAGDAPLREQALTDEYGVARHTVRAALRSLAADGLVRVEPNRGARVATLDPEGVRDLAHLRSALEIEAARLALERHDGRLPPAVHDAAERLAAVCRRRRPAWRTVVEGHEALHGAIVAAAESPRLTAAHRRAEGEQRLYVVQLRPTWTYEQMAANHLKLVDDLEREGPEALRAHIEAGAASILEGISPGP